MLYSIVALFLVLLAALLSLLGPIIVLPWVFTCFFVIPYFDKD